MWIIVACLAIALTLFTEINNMALRRILVDTRLQRDMLMECVQTTARKLKEGTKK